MDDSPKPKPLFYLALLLIVAGLLSYAFRGTLFPSGSGGGGTVTIDDLKTAQGTEAPDPNVPTTVKEYAFKPSEKAATGDREVRLSAACEPDREVRAKRLGGLGTHHSAKQWRCSRDAVEDAIG